MNFAPIVLFVYNRPWHTQQTVEALQRCELAAKSDLYIFADGPKTCATEEQKAKISEVRKYIHTIDGFRLVTIEESETNKGLANSVISGVTKVIEKNGKVIVVEDDIVAHPFFLRFMNEALDIYSRNKRIFQIGAMNVKISIPEKYSRRHDCFLVHRGCSWGWGTWADRWSNVDWKITDADTFFADPKAQKQFNRGGCDMSNMLRQQLDGQIDSWAIRWDYHMFKKKAYGLRPVHSFVYNIGMDGTGVHYTDIAYHTDQSSLIDSPTFSFHWEPHIRHSRQVEKIFHNFWGIENQPSYYVRLKRFVKKKLLKHRTTSRWL